MEKTAKIYVAGHHGLVGSAIWNNLQQKGYTNLVGRSHKELDLLDGQAVKKFFDEEQPQYVILAAAHVGGIMANSLYRADFIYQNLQIQQNVIGESFRHDVKKLLFLGSTCIYPRDAVQPMKEDVLLTSPLEYTNEPYAIAKIAGRNAVHAFVEEMKHNSGEKLKTRLFPSLRGGPANVRCSAYYEGVTGVSDTARVDLGEDDWFEDYEKKVNPKLIEEIATVALEVNRSLYRLFVLKQQERDSKDPVLLEKMRLESVKLNAFVARWKPRLADMRRNAIYYIRASSFCNKDILGPKFFKTQLDTLDTDEFLTAICAIRHKEVTNKFFINYDHAKHQFKDSYKYESILRLNLKDRFILTAEYLLHYDPHEPLYMGYDPGNFQSLIVAQKKDYGRRLDIIKEFFAFLPKDYNDLVAEVHQFFGSAAVNKTIYLYPDRAGNKRREEREQITTDSLNLKAALESYGFMVILYNEDAPTIYHWQQFKLCQMLFGERSPLLPAIRIDENECKNLCSAIMISPLKKTDGKIELDKSSEKKQQLKNQAGLTTQLPSAMIYLLYGLYSDAVKAELSTYPTDLPDNFEI